MKAYLVFLFGILYIFVYADCFSQNYSQVTVTGFNYDMIANGGPGTNQAYNTTNVIFDGDNAYAGHVMYSTDFRGNYNQSTAPEGGLPSNRLITSANNSAITYLLQSYDASNVLYLNNTSNVGTLTLSVPQSYQRLAILASSAEGASSFTVRLNFNDATYADYSFSVPDWFNGTGYAIQKIGRVNARNYSSTYHDRYDDIDGTTTNNPRLYDCFITLTNNDMFKVLTSIRFTKTVSGNSRTVVLAVCGLNPLSAPVALPATNATASAFTANWNSVANATKYRLDVSMTPDFSSFITGYNNLDVGGVLNYSLSGLSGGTYYYRVRAENSYGQSIHSNVITAALFPSGQASGITFSNVSVIKFKITWTRGTGTNCAVFIRQTDTGSAAPVNGASYISSPVYSLGSQIGTSGWYCVYSGAGTSVTVTGLSAGTTYRAMVCEFNSTTSPAYNPASNSGNTASRSTVSPNQANNIIFHNVTQNSLSLNWVNGNGGARCVFMKSGNGGTAAPVNNTTYTPSTVFRNGTQIGSTGWYCIFNGSASMFAGDITVTNLDFSTPYTLMVCEYFDSTGSEYYITNSAALNPNVQETLLPVKLESFTSYVLDNAVTLKWTTASENNNSGFDIERKKIPADVWEKTGFVKGSGNSSVTKNYTFTDIHLNSGSYLYRIKQTDYNGNFEYFSLGSAVEIGRPARYTMSQNYPNPFNPVTRIDFSIAESGIAEMSLYDLSGKKIENIFRKNLDAGYYSTEYNAGRLASGIYIVRLVSGTFSKSIKIAVVK